MTEYKYDPALPYVVVTRAGGHVQARFRYEAVAEAFSCDYATGADVIDTTPAPRVPDDAKFVTWKLASGATRVSRATRGLVQCDGGWVKPEDLPGVTPETTFTVLEEKKS